MATRRWVLTVTALLVTVASWWPASAADSATLLDRLNALRSERGLRPLHPAADLDSVATRHAAAMADANELAHNPSLAEQVANWRIVGENVGVGPDLDAIHDAFVASPRHLANLVESRYLDVGLGVVERDGRLWVVEVFRTPVTAPAAAAAPAAGAPAAEPAPVASEPVPTPATPAVRQHTPSAAPARTPARAAAPTQTAPPSPAPAPVVIPDIAMAAPVSAPTPQAARTQPQDAGNHVPGAVVVAATVLWLVVAIEVMNGTRIATKRTSRRRHSRFAVELPAS